MPSISEIQRRESVLKAIEEFDRIGRDAFLAKYGFGKSREYYLRYQGELYDSKAILGAAYKFEFPECEHLTGRDFIGGATTVVPRLSALGFDVFILKAAARRLPSPVAPGGVLIVTTPPAPQPPREPRAPRRSTRRAAQADHASRDAENRALGKLGEALVVAHERRALAEAGRGDLAKKVEHVAETQGDGLGYDVLSFTAEGERKLIEVKTTRGDARTPFFLTANELAVADENAGSFHLYRVFGYSEATDTASLFVLRPPFDSSLVLTPTVYRAEPV